MDAVHELALRFNSAAPARQKMSFKPVKCGYELRVTVADYNYSYGGVDHMDASRDAVCCLAHDSTCALQQLLFAFPSGVPLGPPLGYT